MNAQQAAMLGLGQDVTTPFPIQASVLAPKLSRALHEVLGSDKFHQATAHTSKLMRARRWTPAEEAASTHHCCGSILSKSGLPCFCRMSKAGWCLRCVFVSRAYMHM